MALVPVPAYDVTRGRMMVVPPSGLQGLRVRGRNRCDTLSDTATTWS